MTLSTHFKTTTSLFCCVIALLTPGWGCNTHDQEPESTATRAVEVPAVPFDATQHVNAWVAMWNSYDLNQVDVLFLTDDTVTYFSSEKEGLIQGIDAVREHHRGFGFVEGGKPAEKELWVEDLHSNVHGATAVVTGIWYFGSRAEDRDPIQRGPMTAIHVRKGNDYRLAHLHFSNYEDQEFK